MKKTVLLIFFLLIYAIPGITKPRSSSDALNVATSFCKKNKSSNKRISSEGAALSLAYACTNTPAVRSLQQNVCYYVFNIGENNGFVIVSGDNRTKEILGYSDNGSFDINSLPANFSAWLAFYQKEMQVLMDQPEIENSTTIINLSPTKDSVYAASVAPLLGGIKWNQGSPYNNLCPVINASTGQKAVTGCVATAMAMVMKYHQWPAKGTGSNSYIPRGFTTPLTVNFSQAIYDWENMNNNYNGLNTQIQQDAVATLMYHAGVAVNMNYGKTSSATTHDMAKALINYFGYDPNLQYYERDYYSLSEWKDLLKTELNAQRPVLYAGSSTDVGHQFVCDGYNSDGLFHFNWGWGGYSDGYYELSALNPGTLGIGGGTSGGYNSDQSIVIGVEKAGTSPSLKTYQFCLFTPIKTSNYKIDRFYPFTTACKLFNIGINTFTGAIGIALYSNNKLVQVINYFQVENLQTNSGWNERYFTATIPSSIANGNYKLYCVTKAVDQTDWHLVRGKVGTPNYFNVTVSDGNVILSVPDVMPKLGQKSLSVTGNLYQYKLGRFHIEITNSGEEYNSMLALRLKSVVNDSIFQIVSTDPINIPAGESRSYDFEKTVLVTPGQYSLTALYDPTNNRYYSDNVAFSQLGDSLPLNVLAEPTTPAALKLTSKISFGNTEKISKDNVVLTAHLKNTGGYYNNYVIAQVFPVSGSDVLTSFGYQKIILDTNEDKTILFKGSINLTPGNYLVSVNYWNETTTSWGAYDPDNYGRLDFTLDNEYTGLENTAQSKPLLYPIPATSILYLHSEEAVESILITDLSGKLQLLLKPEKDGEIAIPVSELNKGLYILRWRTIDGVKNSKFLKE